MEDVEGMVTINEAKFNYFEALGGEMRYCKISKEMSPLYFELDVFCLFDDDDDDDDNFFYLLFGTR
jgi:hypothetical protein